MSRKPTPKDARLAFAKLLDKLMKDGVNAVGTNGEKAAVWNNAALAARVDHFRVKTADEETSPRMIANWRNGVFLPANVEPLISAIYGEPPKDGKGAEALRRAYRLAHATKLGADIRAAKIAGAPQWSVKGDQAALGREARPTDFRAASDVNRRQLQSGVRETAEKLAELIANRMPGLRNDLVWKDLGATAAALAAIAGLDPKALVKRLGDGYRHALQLGAFLETDTRLREEREPKGPPLDAEIRGALTNLVWASAAWMRGFPSVAKMDDDAGKLLQLAASVDQGRKFVVKARDEAAISATDAQEVDSLASAADQETVPGKKAAALSTAIAINLLATLAEALAQDLAGVVAPEDSDARHLARKAHDTLRASPMEVAALTGERTFFRQAVRALLEAGERKETAAPAGEERPSYRAKIFISYAHADEADKPNDGQVDWLSFVEGFLRPAQKQGVFELWVDSDMRGGDAWEKEIALRLGACDVFILLCSRQSLGSDFIVDKEIPAIQARHKRGEDVRFYPILLTATPKAALDLVSREHLLRPKDGKPLSAFPLPERERAMAEIADEIVEIAREIGKRGPVAPPPDVEVRALELILKGVAPPAEWRPFIRKLDFRGTAIADATPLSGLTALRSLDLAWTRIADVTPLADLTALTSLNLSDTKIANAAPLAGLTALTSLDLAGTQIADATPLGRLTALTSLNLSDTKIANAAPLAGLTALTSLNLHATKIADATPLAGLTALTSLDLSYTDITDAAPLAGLTALTSLDLSYTDIADAAPLANLSELKDLYLGESRVADQGPLSALIAKGLKVEWR